jgi:hypothetical protein
MGLSDSRSRPPPRLLIPTAAHRSPPAPGRVSQVSWLFFPHAPPPSTPGSLTGALGHCFPASNGFGSFDSLATPAFKRHEALLGSLSLRLTRSPPEGIDNAGFPAFRSFGYMLMINYMANSFHFARTTKLPLGTTKGRKGRGFKA